MSGVTIVVPVKRLEGAKSRLAEVLGPEARRELVLEMLAGVLASAVRSRAKAVLVVTRDPAARRAALEKGIEVLDDSGSGLNASLLSGFRCCWGRGEVPLYLPADLPHVDTETIDRLLDCGRDGNAVVLAPAHDGGTNALMSPGAAPLRPRLGPRSFERHLEAARRRGLETRVFRSRTLELDVDTPADLEAARSFA